MKIAVIGSGISGLTAAYLAQLNGNDVHLFEKANYFGGHSNTIQITNDENSFPVDTGFLVHNTLTYPNLIQLFELLGIKISESQMTLSIQLLNENIEWSGSDLTTVFGQKRNIFRIDFYRMILDILKFNKLSPNLLEQARQNKHWTLRDLLIQHQFSPMLRDWYIVPMAAAIWSTPADQILDFPAYSFLQFCDNHHLLQVSDRPVWRSIIGGSKEYVQKMVATIPRKYLQQNIEKVERIGEQVVLSVDGENLKFDAVIFANHPDQILAIAKDLTSEEQSWLSCFKYQKNTAVVHSDESFLPQRKKLWSSWNYVSSPLQNKVSVSYLINQLQPLPTNKSIIVTLNPHKDVNPSEVHKTIEYEHPCYDQKTMDAQLQTALFQGRGGYYFTGAWQGYGFHEDGLKSALRVAKKFQWSIPWRPVYE